MLVSMIATPDLQAAAPNGSYKFVKASGSLTAAGETIRLDDDMIKNFAALKNGRLTIAKNRLQIDRTAALKAIKQLANQLGITFKTSITGPNTISLKKVGTSYSGQTSRPIVVKFSANYQGQAISGKISSNFKVKIKGRILTLTVPITGNVMGYGVKGKIVVTLKRV